MVTRVRWWRRTTLRLDSLASQPTGRNYRRHRVRRSCRCLMQVTNQFFFVEELERTIAFGVDGVSEAAFNSWKYRDDRAALMVVGCIVDPLANRKFRQIQ